MPAESGEPMGMIPWQIGQSELARLKSFSAICPDTTLFIILQGWRRREVELSAVSQKNISTDLERVFQKRAKIYDWCGTELDVDLPISPSASITSMPAVCSWCVPVGTRPIPRSRVWHLSVVIRQGLQSLVHYQCCCPSRKTEY